MNRSTNLYHLQKVDKELDSCQQRIAHIDDLLQRDDALRAARSLWQAAHDAAELVTRKRVALESDVAALTAKAQAAEARLYGGMVKSPKEMQELQDVGRSLKQRIGEQEEHLLEAIMEQDELDAQLDSARRALSNAANEWETYKAQQNAERELVVASMVQWQQERQNALAPISQEDRVLYQKLRDGKRGVAVSAVQNSSCRTCGLAMSMQREREARNSNDLVFCGNCGRILFVA